MNGKTPGRPGRPRRPMTREEYEKMTAERLRRAKAARRNKRRKTALSVILCLVFVASAVFIVYKVKSGSNYRDPAERLGDSPSATIPSGVNTDPVTTAPATEPTDGGGSGSFKFIAAGDNIIHSAVFEDARKRAGGSGYDFLSMYNGIADTVKSADVKYVNQETPMAGASYGIQGYPSFNSPQEAGDALVALGFNTVNIATNHMLDMGTSGLADSIKYWKTKDVTLLGAYTKSDYDNIRVQEAGGIKIAWLSYTYGINGNRDVGSSSDIVIPIIDDTVIRRQTELAKKAGDIVIASMHWGTDSAIPVDNSQKQYAKLLADCGVDVIIGTHSHTLQPVEWITSSDGKHRTLCYYSLGNLINTGYEYYKMVGGLASFTVVKDENGVSVNNAMLIPTMCHYSMNRDGLAVYLLENYTEELCAAHGSHRSESSVPNFDFSTLKKTVTDAVDKQFLPDFYK